MAKSPYTEYEGCPRILKSDDIVESTFELVAPTVYGLLDDLIPGSELSDRFLAEWEKFQSEGPKYGVPVYYPRKKHLVKFAPPEWHRLALLVRNSTLLRDPEMKMSWQKVRELFEKAVVAITGCSVGNNAAHAVARDIRPLHLKIADQKEYHLTNANRTPLNYEDFGRNKALVTAEQIHSVDPFMKISVFSEGVHPGNFKEFIGGNPERLEPPANAIIEEADDPDIKILIREEARRQRVPIIMVTDLGSAVQLDIRRFDVDGTLPLASCAISDEELYSARDHWRADLADRQKFYDFLFAMVGRNHVFVPEFKQIILKEGPILFAGVPQLGSTAMMAGGIAAEAAARLILGFKLPERMFINKHTGKTIIEGKML